MARIGFIGLGNMGLPMAQNLLKAGHQVEGVDVNPAAIEKLKAAGGASVEAAKGAASRADVVITMLPSGKEVRDVYLGSSGIIENANAGTLLIDCSTIDVETARAVAAEAEKKGLLMLDAPVSGGVGGATAGNAHVHGRRQRAGIRARPIDPRENGQDNRARGRCRQRAGRQDLQQYDPWHIDDCCFGSLRPGREAWPRSPEVVRHFFEVVGAMLVFDNLLSRTGTGSNVARQPRLPGRDSPRR